MCRLVCQYSVSFWIPLEMNFFCLVVLVPVPWDGVLSSLSLLSCYGSFSSSEIFYRGR
ncbi:hypothetical protein M432DRAFT_663286 [Thermoascus aurantiacus ATCC 26904]